MIADTTHRTIDFVLCRVDVKLPCRSKIPVHGIPFWGQLYLLSDLAFMEVSQRAYASICIRSVMLFEYLYTLCKRDMGHIYFFWINFVWAWVCLRLGLWKNVRTKYRYDKRAIRGENYWLNLVICLNMYNRKISIRKLTISPVHYSALPISHGHFSPNNSRKTANFIPCFLMYAITHSCWN